MGHRAGDEVLSQVASRLRTCLRCHDVCARLGGDEFAVILVDTAAHAATEIAERMVRDAVRAVRRRRSHRADRRQYRPYRRAGWTQTAGSARADGVSAEELYHRADVAMYAAKANGKGQIQWFDPTLLHPGLATVAVAGQ